MLDQIKTGFTAIFKSNPKKINALVALLKTELASKTFIKSRQQIHNIASNLLSLLCQLKEKQIALRDLKPDNLFLDADPDNYPVFLNDVSSFSIGVIDVETAVSLTPPARWNRCSTFNRGHTFVCHATALAEKQNHQHLLRESVRSAAPSGLVRHHRHYFQGGYRGKPFSPRCPDISGAFKKFLNPAPTEAPPDEATVKKMSKTFWSAASMDIKKQLTTFSGVLNQLTVLVPEAMVPSIRTELERESACLHRAINNHISLSPLMKSPKNKDFLINAAMADIFKQIDRWQNVDLLPEQHRQLAPQMVSFLNNLNRLKRGEKEKQDAVESVASAPYEITAYALLEAMFQIAFRFMYRSRWKTLTKPASEPEEKIAVKEDKSLVTTIISEN